MFIFSPDTGRNQALKPRIQYLMIDY